MRGCVHARKRPHPHPNRLPPRAGEGAVMRSASPSQASCRRRAFAGEATDGGLPLPVRGERVGVRGCVLHRNVPTLTPALSRRRREREHSCGARVQARHPADAASFAAGKGHRQVTPSPRARGEGWGEGLRPRAQTSPPSPQPSPAGAGGGAVMRSASPRQASRCRRAFADEATDRGLPRPACGERVGVRGCVHARQRPHPHPSPLPPGGGRGSNHTDN